MPLGLFRLGKNKLKKIKKNKIYLQNLKALIS